MRVLMLSTHDKSGGAAISIYRIHQAQLQAGIDSQMLVRDKITRDPMVHSVRRERPMIIRGSYLLSQLLEHRALKKYPDRTAQTWHTARIPNAISTSIALHDPDIILLDWIWDGFVPVSAISHFKKPVIWKLSDSAALTGGCHISYECTKFHQKCGKCPVLKSDKEHDLSRRTWEHKAKHLNHLKLTIVTLSRWMAERCKSSSLFGHHDINVIPCGLDLETFRPIDKNQARTLLNLPQDKKLIMFGAVNSLSTRNKGFHLLQPALQEIATQHNHHDTEVIIFGAHTPQNPPDIPFKTHYPGILHDELSLALIYSAADVMIVPSLQEAFGQTASEALACGTPVVAFGATGLLDIVDHQQNGYLATPYDPKDLARGIMWILEVNERHNKLSQNARETAVKKFNIHDIARQYIDLYENILNRTSKNI